MQNSIRIQHKISGDRFYSELNDTEKERYGRHYSRKLEYSTEEKCASTSVIRAEASFHVKKLRRSRLKVLLRDFSCCERREYLHEVRLVTKREGNVSVSLNNGKQMFGI